MRGRMRSGSDVRGRGGRRRRGGRGGRCGGPRRRGGRGPRCAGRHAGATRPRRGATPPMIPTLLSCLRTRDVRVGMAEEGTRAGLDEDEDACGHGHGCSASCTCTYMLTTHTVVVSHIAHPCVQGRSARSVQRGHARQDLPAVAARVEDGAVGDRVPDTGPRRRWLWPAARDLAWRDQALCAWDRSCWLATGPNARSPVPLARPRALSPRPFPAPVPASVPRARSPRHTRACKKM